MTLPSIPPYTLPRPTDVDPPRVAWSPHPARGALLIHDMQRHFVAPYASDWLHAEVVPNILKLRACCRELGIPVFYSAQPAQQTPEQRGLLTEMWGLGLCGNEEGAEIIPALRPDPDEVVLTKWRYSAFARTDFEALLHRHGRTELYLCGIYTHIGCLTTTLDAFMRDFRTFLVTDATADFSEEHHRAALRQVARCCGNLRSTQGLCDEMRQTATPTPAWMADLAALLEMPLAELTPTADLRDLGLDSLRLMTLIEQERARNPDLDPSFVALAGCTTVDDLRHVLEAP